jgi:chlorite dismutase
MASQLFSFIGGDSGDWRVVKMNAVVGATLETVNYLQIFDEDFAVTPPDAHWVLRGTTSYGRYVERAEKEALSARQPTLNRPEAVCAALIPISKSEAWWNLAQDERRKIFEEQSKHIEFGLKYLPAIARRLHHCRDLGEPFDFLTWFEYAPADADAFEELVDFLRRSEEWRYVEREVDIRLIREQTQPI